MKEKWGEENMLRAAIAAGFIAQAILSSANAYAQESAEAESGAKTSQDDVLDQLLIASESDEESAESSTGTLQIDPPAPYDTIPVDDTDDLADSTVPRERRRAIEEIIVTARRREESLQDVPISITALSSEQLQNANVVNAADLAKFTPGLSINTRFGTDSASFAIRGFSQELRTTASVAVYFAEVVAPRGQTIVVSGDGAAPGELSDVQNVQVLKGPQGTLFGRNTTGGAVLIVPNRPEDEFGGYLQLSGGDYNAIRAEGVLNLPVTDDFRLRLGVDTNKRDGYLNNVTRIGTDDLLDIDYMAFRVSGVLDISDTIENYTILSYSDSQNHGIAGQMFACDRGPILHILVTPDCQNQLNDPDLQGDYDVSSSVPNPTSLIKQQRMINTTTWHATDNLTAKAIVAYAHLVADNETDFFGTQFRSALNPAREYVIGNNMQKPGFRGTSQQTWVGELQLLGTAFGDKLEWQGGVYYERSTPDGVSGNRSAVLIECELASLAGDPSGFRCFDPTAGLLGAIQEFEIKTSYLNRAIFGQGTYQISDSLAMTVGLRYTWDETEGEALKSRHTFALGIPLPVTTTRTTPETKSDAPTGVIGFDYRPSDSGMYYAKYMRGYRQGSVNLGADDGIDTFEPETLDSYEIGAKLTPVSLPITFNAALFYNDLRNQQLQVGYFSNRSGLATAIFNAGKSRIAGVEIESIIALSENLRLGISYTYLDTLLQEQEDRRAETVAAVGPLSAPVTALTYTPIAVEGDTLPFAADHQVSARLNYSLPLPYSIGTVDLGTTYVYVGERRTSSSESDLDILRPFELLNFNANWRGVFGSQFDVSAYMTNALDKKYETFYGDVYTAIGVEYRNLGEPRMFGARVRYSF